MILPYWFYLVLSLLFSKKSEQKPNDWFFQQRAFPHTSIPQDQYREAVSLAKQMAKSQLRSGSQSWKFAGPTNVGGRITDIEVSPKDSMQIFVGAASGGVFKSTDGGQSWLPIFDSNPILSIGDIAIDPLDPNTIYVGTGEPNGGGGSIAYEGNGIFKSEDGGNSWLYIGMEQAGSISKILIHPTKPNTIYASAMGRLFAKNQERGIYKSIDGGEKWEKVFFHSDSVGVIDLVMDIQHPDTLYAATWERIRRPSGIDYGGKECNVYSSFDGGKVWIKLVNGLPTGTDKGRIGLSVSPSDPNKIVAFYVDESGDFLGVYKSIDYGKSWVKMAGRINAATFGWWFGKIYFDLQNSNIIYGLGLNGAKSIDGGNQFLVMTDNFGDEVHVDQHALYIYPHNSNHLLLGNDGGLYESLNAGETWKKINNLPITQFYTCHIDYSAPDRLYGGSQDNSSIKSFNNSLDNWQIFNGGDGFVCLVDPTDNRYVYTESQYGILVRSTDGGNSFQQSLDGIDAQRNNWNTPVVFDPANSAILYYGADKLYKSTNRAANWFAISPSLTPNTNLLRYGTITTISVSPLDSKIIYCGTDVGWVWVTKDGGQNWIRIDGGLPERWITSVYADPFNKEKVYLTISGYRYNESLPHVFVSENAGASWKDISRGLPPLPCNKIMVDPDLPGHLMVATDAGVFRSSTDGRSWQILGNELPQLVITDLHFHRPSRKLVAATYGRGMYTYNLELPTAIHSAIDNKQRIDIYPNPIKEKYTIRVESAKKEKIQMKLFSTSGKLVFQKTIEVFPGQTEFTQNLPIPSGVYMALFSSSQGIHRSIRIIKN